MTVIDEGVLACPCAHKEVLIREAEGYRCSRSGCAHAQPEGRFPLINGKPILISTGNCDTLCDPTRVKSYVRRSKESPLRRFYQARIVGVSRTTIANCAAFVGELKQRSKRPRVLVIGSGEQGAGTGALFSDADIAIVGLDIYESGSVDVVADAHYLPFEDESFDGVWIQAVLEHVLEPAVVVSEIHRVLNKEGVVYAETPFMQQVHEGGYDFTRFTVLGHRYLFKRFDCISIGGNRGVGVAFSWSLKYAVWAITRSRHVSQIFYALSILWARLIDRLAARASLFDGSSGVFFLGTKSDKALRHADIPPLYKGLQ